MSDSPIEKQAFRSRSFRRSALCICVFFLLIASLHGITTRPILQKEFAQEYIKFYKPSSSIGSLSDSQGKDETSFQVCKVLVYWDSFDARESCA